MLDASDVVSDGPVPSWDRPVVDMSRDTALTVVVLACGFECPSCGVWGSLRIRVVRWVVGSAGCRLESRWGGGMLVADRWVVPRCGGCMPWGFPGGFLVKERP